jgi:hypothetical protein
MGKIISSLACCCVVTLMAAGAVRDGGTTADAEGAPLTPALVNEIRKNPYVDESVQTTNGNIVGLFIEVVSNKSGQPVLGVIQAYDNVTRSKQLIAVPWQLFRFDERNQRIQIQAAADQLRSAPVFRQNQIAGLAEGPELLRIQEHFRTALGGGSVAASAGSQSGKDSSVILGTPATNDAQPSRGSVAIMYLLAAAIIVGLGFAYFTRRRT